MVKTCLSKNHGFVIVFNANNESDGDFTFSKKGSFVEIIDFNNLPNGLLGITVKSINKVIVSNICQLEDGLHVANTKPQIDPEVDDQAVLAEYPETYYKNGGNKPSNLRDSSISFFTLASSLISFCNLGSPAIH